MYSVNCCLSNQIEVFFCTNRDSESSPSILIKPVLSVFVYLWQHNLVLVVALKKCNVHNFAWQTLVKTVDRKQPVLVLFKPQRVLRSGSQIKRRIGCKQSRCCSNASTKCQLIDRHSYFQTRARLFLSRQQPDYFVVCVCCVKSSDCGSVGNVIISLVALIRSNLQCAV